jgi:hypothetical protein
MVLVWTELDEVIHLWPAFIFEMEALQIFDETFEMRQKGV